MQNKIITLQKEIPENTTLVAVSKTRSIQEIKAVYTSGHKIFGENRVQELLEKYHQLPQDIQWHMIGHLQRNKVKYIAPFIHLIHSLDSAKLAREIDKQAHENQRTINCLLQVHIAEEQSKFGIPKKEVLETYRHIKEVTSSKLQIIGLMGMATHTSNTKQTTAEFSELNQLFNTIRKEHPKIQQLSMGMSNDYKIAVNCGSTMLRIGSKLF